MANTQDLVEQQKKYAIDNIDPACPTPSSCPPVHCGSIPTLTPGRAQSHDSRMRRSFLTLLAAHASGVSCVDISPDVRALAAVGLDAQARQTIALWNISEMRNPQRKVLWDQERSGGGGGAEICRSLAVPSSCLWF